MLLAAVAIWALGPPSADSVAILPLQVDGRLDSNARAEFVASLRAGLTRADFVVAEAIPSVDPGHCDAQCLEAARAEAGVEHLIRARVTVASRVYRIHLDVIGAGGETIATTEDGCEVCGRSDAAELIAAQGARARWKLEVGAEGEAPPAPRPTPPPASAATPPPTTNDGPSPTDDRRPLRVWGGVALGAGIASLGAGIALAVADGRPYRRRCTGQDIDFQGTCRFEFNTLGGGIAAMVVGTGLLATGVALLVRDRRLHARKRARTSMRARRTRF